MTEQVEVTVKVDAAPAEIWNALTDPKIIKSYFFGADVHSDWTAGSSISWTGSYEGKDFNDKGKIVAVDPPRRLEMTHWSPLSGLEDKPGNYHHLIWNIRPHGAGSEVTLTQRNLTGVKPEKARDSWRPVLDGLKRVLES